MTHADFQEFYRKCFGAHEQLTGQIDWAQAEANQSRERVLTEAYMDGQEEVRGTTMEEQALALLFEAHSALADALKHHDDLERVAMDEEEMREVQERSKQETRMERSDILMPPTSGAGGSSSRSTSPAPPIRSGGVTSPRGDRPALPVPPAVGFELARTPSPDRMTHLRALPTSPVRSTSPLGQHKARNTRPLPNPFKTATASTQSLSSGQNGLGTQPSRSGTGSTNDSGPGFTDAEGNAIPPVEGEDAAALAPPAPSRKALGKRRAVEDPDSEYCSPSSKC